MIKVDLGDVLLKHSTEFHVDKEYCSYIIEHEFSICIPVDDDLPGSEEYKKIGDIVVYELQLDLMLDNGISVLDAVDGHSSELYEFYEEFRLKQNQRLTEDKLFHRIIYLNSIEIEKEYRGQNIGHVATIGVVDAFAYCMAVLKPGGLSSAEYNEIQRKRAIKKLTAYWSEIGFDFYRKKNRHLYRFEQDRHVSVSEIIETLQIC
jgi:hypothetical protein